MLRSKLWDNSVPWVATELKKACIIVRQACQLGASVGVQYAMSSG
jgi:hypothetical protein